MKNNNYTSPSDLEFGGVYISRKVQKLVNLYRKNEHRIKYILISFCVVTTALIIKYASRNVDSVIESATAITFDEETYTPFVLSNEILSTVESGIGVRKFPIKGSKINWKMQTLNIVQARNKVWEYLGKAKQTCIHLKHFGVPYDILVFNNITMVNPEVLMESDEHKKIKEMSLDGSVNRKNRPIWIKVGYYSEALIYQSIILWGAQSYCFAHYEF